MLNLFKVNNKDVSDLVLVSLMLTWTHFTHCCSVFIVDFEQLNTGSDGPLYFSASIIFQQLQQNNSEHWNRRGLIGYGLMCRKSMLSFYRSHTNDYKQLIDISVLGNASRIVCYVNPFVPNAPSTYPLKESENRIRFSDVFRG